MGDKLRYKCLLETRRLLLLMGVVFAFFLFVQYIELPYSNILSSLFSNSKAQVDIFPGINETDHSSSNSNETSVVDVASSATNVSNGKISDAMSVKDGFDTEDSKSLNETLVDDIDPEDETPPEDFLQMNGSSIVEGLVREDSFPLEETKETSDKNGGNVVSQETHPITTSARKDGFNLENNKNSNETLIDDIDPEDETPSKDFLQMNGSSTVEGLVRNDSFPLEESKDTSEKNEGTVVIEESPPVTTSARKDSETIHRKTEPKITKEPEPAVVPISKMNDMLLQSHVSYNAMKPRLSSRVDQELLKAKSLIENTPFIEEDPQFDVSLYRNFSSFKRSYELMEQTLKVYIYAEGERPIFHQPPLKGIYASEGWFMRLLKANKRFVTKKPNKAHLFYLPFSSRMLEVALYVPDSHNRKPLIATLRNYVEMITTKYSFWNRTGGADHFLVACHDWAPMETRGIMANCIRALCNADVKEGFRFGKDVSLPETFMKSPQNPLRQLGGKPPSKRRILAFFAGNMHGYLRPILLNHWENKDPDMKIFGRIGKVKGQMSYAQYMKSSKYCICAKGFEVNSPRVVEAIFYECVPVIISDNFIPPFFETLNWESFAVFVLEKDIPNLKNILVSIPKKRYLQMQRRVKQVQQHFLWHPRPVKYDIFHMILHSVWYNRVFQTRAS